MSENPSIERLERDADAARRAVEDDLAQLGLELRDERSLLKRRVRDNAVRVVGGAAALGLLAGFGGMKAVKWLLVLGVAGAAATSYARKHAGEWRQSYFAR